MVCCGFVICWLAYVIAYVLDVTGAAKLDYNGWYYYFAAAYDAAQQLHKSFHLRRQVLWFPDGRQKDAEEEQQQCCNSCKLNTQSIIITAVARRVGDDDDDDDVQWFNMHLKADKQQS